jgi:hypothetical protein
VSSGATRSDAAVVARPAAEDDLAWFMVDAVAQMNTTLLYDPKFEFQQQAHSRP